jgi:hypothetical protein
MLEYDEKRNYIRMKMDCDITYKLAGTDKFFRGRCSSLSGSGLSFLSDELFAPGKALEINIIPSSVTPPMTAFVEVVRAMKKEDDKYEIAASIKSIKTD